MKRKAILVVLTCAAILIGSPQARSSGFLIYEHGAAAMGMAGAFVSVANDPSAIFHNPAGIAWLEGTHINFGTTLIRPVASLSLPNWPDPTYRTVDQENQLFYPPSFYITNKFSDRITAGFGFFVPFGLGVAWPEDYPLQYISIKDDMKTFIFNPTVAVKLSDNVSFGFGVSYIHATLFFKLVEHQIVDIGPQVGLPVAVNTTLEIPVELDASGSAFGLNAGLLYKGEQFSLGFNWRGGYKMKFDGDLALGTAKVTIPAPYNQLIPASLVAGSIPSGGSASIPEFNFPHILGVGASFNLTETLLWSVDVHYTLWSSYDEFTVEVEVPGFADKHVEENWEDSFLFRTGFQYSASESLALRGGFFYDQTPQPAEFMDPILPDADRIGFTVGIGYRSGNFVLDVAYQYEPFKDRTSPNRYIFAIPGGNLGEGTYSTTAHLFGVSLGFDL